MDFKAVARVVLAAVAASKALVQNVALAAVAAFTGAVLAAGTDELTKGLVIAAAYAAVRAALGVVYAWASSRKAA